LLGKIDERTAHITGIGPGKKCTRCCWTFVNDHPVRSP
jgi:hypothetical protein